MSDFRIVRDAEIFDLLINLTRPEILGFQQALQDCLVDFSTTAERHSQPLPGIINRPEGQKCLFRAFTSKDSVGTKIIVDPSKLITSDAEQVTSGDGDVDDATSLSHTKQSRVGKTDRIEDEQTRKARERKEREKGGLHGLLSICDSHGFPRGVLNAEEITGYRTSLSALIPFVWRRRVENLVVFGAGKQALWHLRLALALRGEQIKSICVVNRNAERSRDLIATIGEENDERWRCQTELQLVDANREEDVREKLELADVVFCTVPSTKPLFPAKYLTERQKRDAPLVTAIGSWQAQMIELDPDLIRIAVASDEMAKVDRKVIVDDKESCMTDTGEMVQSKIDAEDVVEIGKVLAEKASPDSQTSGETRDESDLQKWLSSGMVIYKSVGVSVTDLAAGNQILALAEKKNVGMVIQDF